MTERLDAGRLQLELARMLAGLGAPGGRSPAQPGVAGPVHEHWSDTAGVTFMKHEVRAKRVRKLERHLPATFALLGTLGVAERATAAFCEAVPPLQDADVRRPVADGRELARFLAGPGLATHRCWYLAPLLDYECVRLATTLRPWPARQPSARPRLADGVAVVRYDLDVAELAARLRAGETLVAPRPEPTCYLVDGREGGPLVRRIEPRAWQALSRLGEADEDGTDLPHHAADIVRQARRMGLVEHDG